MCRGRSFVCLVAAAAILSFTTIARADDEERLIGEIESVLREIKDKLDGAADDSSTSDIDRAMDYARQVEDLAEKLKSANPQTDKGKTMANYYRDYARKFAESAKYLRESKQRQLQQQNDRLAEKCAEAQHRLRDEINRFVEKNDPAGLYKIPDLAEYAARDYQEPHRKDVETHREMERWKEYARNFSESDGRWSDVRSELHEAANGIWETWRRRHEDTLDKCKDLIRAKENPIAVEAMKQLSGNKEIRLGLIKELEVQVKNVYSEIKDIDRRSDDGASEIQDAQRAAEEILRLLEKLKYARGEDEDAKRITDYWPDRVKSLQEALSALKKLKAGQHIIDRGVESCTAAETELREFIQKHMDGKDDRVDGWLDIEEKAKQLGDKYKPKLDNAESHRRDMESWRTAAMNWNPPDAYGWPDVKSALNSAAEGTYSYYKSTLEKVDVACKQLSWGAQHPEVKQAIRDLKEHASSRDSDYVKLRDKARAFEAKVRSYRKLTLDDVDAIRAVACKESKEDLDDAVKEIADRWADKLKSEWSVIEPEAKELKDLADELIKRKVPSASKIKGSIGSLMKSVEKTRDNVNKGAGNPHVKAALEYGDTKHAELERGCDISEKVISSRYCTNPHKNRKKSDCIPDCIKGCTVIEFKKDNRTEIAKGEAQSAAYAEGLRRWYRAEGDKLFEGDYAKLKECVKGEGDNKQLEIIDGRVTTYDWCRMFDHLFEGVEERDPSVEIPDKER